MGHDTGDETIWEFDANAATAVADITAQVQHDLKNPLMVVRMALESAAIDAELKEAASEALARMTTLLTELGRLSNAMARDGTSKTEQDPLEVLKESIPGLTVDTPDSWVGPLPGGPAGIMAIIMEWAPLLGGASNLHFTINSNGSVALTPKAGANEVILSPTPLKLWRFSPGHEGYVPWKTALQAQALGLRLRLRLRTRNRVFSALEILSN